jgi:NAD(P)H-hydrate epimerase
MTTNLDAGIIKKFIPKRKQTSRKGENGIVLVIGGSYLYHGAPILASNAALRSGTDLVYTCVPKINVQSARATSANLIIIPLLDSKLTKGAVNKLIKSLPKKIDSAAIGMGLTIQNSEALTTLIRKLLDMDVRLSIDASALHKEILPYVQNKNVVLTPHAGEFKKIFGEKIPDLIKQRVTVTEKYAKEYSVVILLKGPTDIITDGSITYLNSKKIPAMTVGGTGDVLSGLVAGMLSKNRNALQSAAVASFINSEAGKNVQRKNGLHIVSTDLIEVLPEVMRPFDNIE